MVRGVEDARGDGAVGLLGVGGKGGSSFENSLETKQTASQTAKAEFQASVKRVLDNALQGRGTDNFEFPLYNSEGARVEILLNASTRRDAHGNICGVISVGQDITELMLALNLPLPRN